MKKLFLGKNLGSWVLGLKKCCMKMATEKFFSW